MKVNFVCPNLNHIPESHWNKKLKNQNIDFIVEYGYPKDFDDIVIVSDNEILNPNTNYKNLYGWIIESPDILEHFTPGYFNNVKECLPLYKNIYTHNKDLLDYSDKFKFYPHGDCWVNHPSFDKNKLVSMISSGKDWTTGHKFRLDIVNRFSTRTSFFGRDTNPIENKEEALNNYMYSITVENCKKDYYFTEKIIDCFRTKTIPIYWGCPSIGDFFDINGIIVFDTTDELNVIMNNLTEEYYYSKIDSIENNYKTSFKYNTFFNTFSHII
jgi:hypothetical protein